MSELPQRLANAVSDPMAFAVPVAPRTLALTDDAQGRVAVTRDASGVTTLPLVAAPVGDRVVHETPAGFERRFRTSVVQGASPAASSAWAEPRALVDAWSAGAELLDPATLAVLAPGRAPAGSEALSSAAWVTPLRTATLPPATHTNAVVIHGDDGERWLVDPGADDALELSRVATVARGVSAILLTHHHRDHTTGAARLADRLGVPILAHPWTAARLSDVPVARTLGEGDAGPAGWSLLHTPGHAPGHLCAWHAARRVLVAGDMIASVGTIVIDPPDGAMGPYLSSLARLAGLQPRVVVPAHGAPIVGGAERLRATIAHRLWREARILEALSHEPTSLAQLVTRAYSDVAPSVHWLAERQALAHLRKLVDDARAAEHEGRWSVRTDATAHPAAAD